MKVKNLAEASVLVQEGRGDECEQEEEDMTVSHDTEGGRGAGRVGRYIKGHGLAWTLLLHVLR